MFQKWMAAIVAVISTSTVLCGTDSASSYQFVKDPTLLAKKHCPEGCRGRRGHRGHRGHKGKNGQPGKNGTSGTNGQLIQASHVYADACFVVPQGQTSVNFPVNAPIIFTQVTRSSGVNTTVPGTFTIQSAGDYLITYYVNGTAAVDGDTEILLLLNGSAVTASIFDLRSGFGSNSFSTAGGDTILPLNVGDQIQLTVSGSSLNSTFSSLTAPVKVASLTIEKVSL